MHIELVGGPYCGLIHNLPNPKGTPGVAARFHDRFVIYIRDDHKQSAMPKYRFRNYVTKDKIPSGCKEC